MLDPDVQITRQTEDGQWLPDGTRRVDIRVEFFVGKHGPFSVRVAKDGFTQYKRDDAVMALAREVRTP